MSLTTDPTHPGVNVPKAPGEQNKAYLVLSDEELAKGFVRPLRTMYRHVGIAGPKHPMRILTDAEKERFGKWNYIQFEQYPAGDACLGRYWTQAQLDAVGKGCGTVTTMDRTISATYARQPGFYGATWCCGCNAHLPVGADGEFVWDGTDERVGT